jgi:acyl-CoA reductase-like NAD-dependent aldehyde dehydrogenase
MQMKFAQLAELIADTLAKAPEADKQKLADAIETYADARPNNWQRMQQGTTGRLLDAIIEAVDARPGWLAQLKQMDAEEQLTR